jgi:hypothetical protein
MIDATDYASWNDLDFVIYSYLEFAQKNYKVDSISLDRTEKDSISVSIKRLSTLLNLGFAANGKIELCITDVEKHIFECKKM